MANLYFFLDSCTAGNENVETLPNHHGHGRNCKRWSRIIGENGKLFSVTGVEEICTWGALDFGEMLASGKIKHGIYNLEAFLKASRVNIEKFFTQDAEYVALDTQLLGLDEVYSQFQRKSLGCMNCCPCCGRKCSQEVTDGSTRHKCAVSGGHQLRAMAGMTMGDGNPSFLTCDEVKNDQQIQEVVRSL